MRKLRRTETADERQGRVQLQTQTKAQEAAATEDAIDQRIKRNIELYGP